MSKLSKVIGETEADYAALKIPCLMCCHIADGNFHTLVPFEPHEKPVIEELEKRMVDRLVERFDIKRFSSQMTKKN